MSTVASPLSRTDRSELKVLIVGGGTAGWMTAAALAKKLSPLGVSMTLVESRQIGTVGVGEATLPQIRDFNRMLEIDEAHLISRTKATIKLGIEFCDWGRPGDSYFHPFGAYGSAIGPADFHQYWIRQQLAGKAADFGSYCYAIMCARQDRFEVPNPKPESQIEAYSYAYQFDATLYGEFLAEYATDRGVKRVEGKIVDVEIDDETGFVTGVKLEDGQLIEADIFIDCSGFRGLIIEQALETGYDDWSNYLPCNRALAVPSEIRGEVGPYTRASAKTAGWQWRIPLQHRMGNGLVYCDAFISDQEASDELLSGLDGKALANPKQLYFKTGKRRKLWTRNCIAIGLSGGFLEPLESTSIDLIQSGIMNLLALFPGKACDPLDADEYNRLMDLEFERVRDFLMLHYVANQRGDVPFWREMRTMELPASLSDKIEAFRSRGLVPQYTDGLFLPPSWLSVFIGQNVHAEAYDPRVDVLTEAELDSALDDLRNSIAARVSNVASHANFLKANAEKVGQVT
ncbi:tryptophan halogenase family protein [Henriciella litoralis]|uniref:tryptophan halogenase family protein n=1 Tax=Henriciella litoralis TaxID=568102 RepID=UPI0009FF11E2|nr:tryptophan halogenase family protein [Henriciella litoralis]